MFLYADADAYEPRRRIFRPKTDRVINRRGLVNVFHRAARHSRSPILLNQSRFLGSSFGCPFRPDRGFQYVHSDEHGTSCATKSPKLIKSRSKQDKEWPEQRDSTILFWIDLRIRWA